MRDTQQSAALVTGAGSGIGQAIAVQLAKDGYTVYATDRDERSAQATAHLIHEIDCRGYPGCLDVTSEQSWQTLLENITGKGDRLRALVNNAGICISQPLGETSLQAWQQTLSVNLNGAFLGMKNAIPHMTEQGGSVVNIASVAAIRGIPGLAAYCASKAGLVALTKSVAMECASQGNPVRVNAVLPGAIETPIWIRMDHDGELPDDLTIQQVSMAAHKSMADQATPIGHAGVPEDVANMVSFLASERARFVTGAEFLVDGGAAASA